MNMGSNEPLENDQMAKADKLLMAKESRMLLSVSLSGWLLSRERC